MVQRKCRNAQNPQIIGVCEAILFSYYTYICHGNRRFSFTFTQGRLFSPLSRCCAADRRHAAHAEAIFTGEHTLVWVAIGCCGVSVTGNMAMLWSTDGRTANSWRSGKREREE